MTEADLIARQRTLLLDLVQLGAERDHAEAEIEANFKSRNEAAEREFQELNPKIQSRYQAEKEAAEREYQQALQRSKGRFDAEQLAARREIYETRQRLDEQYHKAKEAIDKEHQETTWTAMTVEEAAKNKCDDQLQEAYREADTWTHKGTEIQKEADEFIKESGKKLDLPPVKATGRPLKADEAPEARAKDLVAKADQHMQRLYDLGIPRFLNNLGLLWVFLGLVLLSPVPGIVTKGKWHLWLAGGVAVAGVVTVLLRFLLHSTLRSQIMKSFKPLCQAVADIEPCVKRYKDDALDVNQRQLARAKEVHDEEVRAANEKQQQLLADITQRRDTELRKAEEKNQRVTAESSQRRDEESRQVEERYQKRITENEESYSHDSTQLRERHDHLLAESQARYEGEKQLLTRGWLRGMAKTQSAVAGVNRESDKRFPSWGDPCWESWSPPAEPPPVLRIGQYDVSLSQLTNGAARNDPALAVGPTGFTLPALIPFAGKSNVLFKVSDAGRQFAVQALQMLMMRLLTALPPGKVRFTIIDPLGLGENFAAFMHLADYDELLVTSRIWTEVAHIEHRLADMTAHMENVIQKYLRNQFETIEQYNVEAGEVAEPFRFLVVANFPANFSSEATRRLISIASTGARCGVYTLVSVDTKQPIPQGYRLADLEQASINFVWKDKRFVWKDADFQKFPLALDAPPPADFCTRILHQVGSTAKDSSRVEVPFEFIAPKPDQWWTGNSAGDLSVPLGRAGATKVQHLKLGLGTSQHVLVAGKTGSGKSTLLHALITNMALMYSPAEVEVYLIDFKKGVEFKTYAEHSLPHARVVAIESEREFGLSVLQRLDAELKRRGDRFRDVSAQNLAAYREADPKAICPRILFIVDEFQEFFVEDDKISQECSLILDRLVRQGRAFGIHVLMGSQTLGGAYSLARSTIDQMAVRIALQCSEADAHLILSEENSAARLLNRPGEAIYNDANGRIEGNNPFQVVWLPDERREDYLLRIQRLSAERFPNLFPPPLVFEGNIPADVSRNHLLNQLLRNPTWAEPPRSVQAWLGDAIAIKDPTAAVFRAQGGSNLMIIGQDERAALGIVSTTLVALACQHAPEDGATRFYVVDGSPPDDPNAGFLARVGAVLPPGTRVVSWRDLPAVIGELAEEVDRRQQANQTDGPARYLFLHGLHRLRDLRKSEDDFGFSSGGDAKASPAKQFTNILREGASLGVHTLLWCDNLNNLNRSLDRQGLREFDMRVLFQMSAVDSSNLIDTPQASKLGIHRAFFYSEERGQPEKFRPYGIPSDDWLKTVRQCIGDRKVLTP